MHIYISGVAGSGLSSIAHMCLDLGYKVSGSDNIHNINVTNLINRGINFNLSQDPEHLAEINLKNQIDIYLHSPSIIDSNPEFKKAKELNLKFSTQNQVVNQILETNSSKLVAISGTHGKTTVTAMIVWLFDQLKIPNSYIIGTNISFGNSGKFDNKSEFLVYEADEYNRKFLELNPHVSIIPTLDYDHPDTYPTKKEYLDAFNLFFSKSKFVFINDSIYNLLKQINSDLDSGRFINIDELIRNNNVKETIFKINLAGKHNRENATLALFAFAFIVSRESIPEALEFIKTGNLVNVINCFPGTSRRFEKIAENLYSDYAHHPIEIKATLQLANEIAIANNQKLVVVYQPHQNARQYELINDYAECFDLADVIYWLPTFLARENANLPVMSADDIIKDANYRNKTVISGLDKNLVKSIKNHLEKDEIVLILGAGNIDQWFRESFNL